MKQQIEQVKQLNDEKKMIAKKLKKFVKLTDSAENIRQLPPSIDHLMQISQLSEQQNQENFKQADVVATFNEQNIVSQHFLF